METEGSLGVEADAEAKFPLPIDETITPQLEAEKKDLIIHLNIQNRQSEQNRIG